MTDICDKLIDHAVAMTPFARGPSAAEMLVLLTEAAGEIKRLRRKEVLRETTPTIVTVYGLDFQKIRKLMDFYELVTGRKASTIGEVSAVECGAGI